MQCPKCIAHIDEAAIDVFARPDFKGFEVSFRCPGCERDFYCIVTPGSFLEADPQPELEEDPHPDPAVTVAILSLVGVTVDEAVAAEWSGEQRLQAVDLAAAVHAEAGDYVGVEIPEMPAFLEEFQGQGSPFLEVT
ncbi:hypothetical protein EG829_00575 [bacterium]|nr:hypothetical protein [bacterium]